VCPWNEGQWKLKGERGVANGRDRRHCLDVGSLGSAYFGGVSFAQPRGGLRLEEAVDGAIARADALFRVAASPLVPGDFLS